MRLAPVVLVGRAEMFTRPSLIMICVLAASLSSLTANVAEGQPTPPPAASPRWQGSIANVTRVESWRFFEPRPGGGDPDYAFLANRFRAEVRGLWPRAELTVAIQHVGFAGLPTAASGPGPFGTGALYFDQADGRENPQQLYLRYANLRLPRVLPGVDVQIGRMPYTEGAETPSGVPKIEQVKNARLTARLLGEFEWSIYQRGYDGVRVDVARPGWKATGVAFMPTQGGFARDAGATMTDIVVTGGSISTIPADSADRPTQLRGFILHYADHRPVTQRPDNTGLSAPEVDVDITTVGGMAVGTSRAGPGEVDMAGWLAVQRGSWYEQTHSAVAIAGEAGYQWTAVPWAPWARAGYFYASGDGDPSDSRHETFFPMLPTVRKYSMTTIYSTMNLRDAFVQLQLRPAADLGLRLDLHRLDLASSSDRWYGGSGATLGRGGAFGYAGRPTGGQARLGSSVELSVNYRLTPRWGVNGFVSRFGGGPAVEATFAGSSAWFVYVENAVTVELGR